MRKEAPRGSSGIICCDCEYEDLPSARKSRKSEEDSRGTPAVREPLRICCRRYVNQGLAIADSPEGLLLSGSLIRSELIPSRYSPFVVPFIPPPSVNTHFLPVSPDFVPRLARIPVLVGDCSAHSIVSARITALLDDTNDFHYPASNCPRLSSLPSSLASRHLSFGASIVRSRICGDPGEGVRLRISSSVSHTDSPDSDTRRSLRS